ncbi:MAG TPA: hypothetical protein V6C81_21765 [Planktothrix sp.]|jgi:hypothetical protein
MSQNASSLTQTWVVRIFATLLVGTLGYAAADVLASHAFHTQLAPLYSGAVGVLAAAVMLALIWKPTAAASDLMGINTSLAPAFKGGKNLKDASCSIADRTPNAKGPGGSSGGKTTAAPTSKPAGRANTASLAPAPATIPADGIIAKTGRISAQATKESDGSITVTISTNGISNSQLKGNNGLFTRVNGVKGVRWSAHKNIGEGKKQVQGTIAADSKETGAAFDNIKKIVQRYV